jgi:hypothetical protein
MKLNAPRDAGLVVVACCVLAGCRGQESDRTEVLPESIVSGDSVFMAPEERVNLPSHRIYYTLTAYDWYARGDALVHEGRGYRPGGMPVSASLTEMTRLGEFQGVEYYRREGDTAAVYVPVFEGYWQSFRTDMAAIDTTTSAPPPPDPDSTATRG